MLAEFDAQTVGIGVMIAAGDGNRKKIGEYFPLLLLDLDEKNEGVAGVRPNSEIPKTFQ